MERDGHTLSGRNVNYSDRPEPVYDNRGEDRVLAEEYDRDGDESE